MQRLGGGLAAEAGDLDGEVGVAAGVRGDAELPGGAGAGHGDVPGRGDGRLGAGGGRHAERGDVGAALGDGDRHHGIGGGADGAGEVAGRQGDRRGSVVGGVRGHTETQCGQREGASRGGDGTAVAEDGVMRHGVPLVGVVSRSRFRFLCQRGAHARGTPDEQRRTAPGGLAPGAVHTRTDMLRR